MCQSVGIVIRKQPTFVIQLRIYSICEKICFLGGYLHVSTPSGAIKNTPAWVGYGRLIVIFCKDIKKPATIVTGLIRKIDTNKLILETK